MKMNVKYINKNEVNYFLQWLSTLRYGLGKGGSNHNIFITETENPNKLYNKHDGNKYRSHAGPSQIFYKLLWQCPVHKNDSQRTTDLSICLHCAY